MTITKEGALASFYTVNKAPIKHLRVYFSPKQAGEGDPSPENVREIDGINYITIFSKGTSIVDFTDRAVIRWYVPENFLEKEVIYWGLIDNTLGTTTVKLSLRLRDANNVSLGTYYSTQTVAPGECKNIWAIFKITTQTNSIQFSVSNATSNTIVKERGLWLYNSEDHVTIDFDSFMYGGYVDLITGELVEEWISINVPDTTDKILGSTGSFINNSQYQGATFTHRYFVISQQSTINVNLLSDKLTKGSCYGSAWKWSYDGTGLLHFSVDNDTIGVTSETSAADRNAAVATWLQENPIQMVYKLKTPIVRQLTPTQLQTLIGKNNIWSNADRVEIEYDLAESNDELYRRRNIILKSAPHIETATGDIASFNADLVMPVKSAKISFNPVQEGEVDPSPDNVRPITGWNDLTIFQANENLLDPTAVVLNDGSNLGLLNYPTSFVYENGVCIGYAPSGTGNQMGLTFKMWLQAGVTYKTSYGQTLAKWEGQESLSQVGIWLFRWLDETRTVSAGRGDSFTPTKSGYYCLNIGTYPSGKVYELRISDIKITIDDDSVFRIADSKKTIVDWTDGIGTIYGGYIDLANEEIVQEWKSVVLNGEENWDSQAPHEFAGTRYDRMFLTNTFPDMIFTSGSRGLISSMPTSTTKSQKSNTGILCGQFGWGDRRFYIFNATQYLDGVSDVATLRAYLSQNPIQICYKLGTPIHHTITPTQLTTLRGTNNIWANTNSQVEIKYWTH